MDVSKQVGYALVLGPDGLLVAKATGYATLVYPRIDLSKQVDYAQLANPNAQVAKQVVYALLREAPPEVEVSVDFTASATLDLIYSVEPELEVFVSLAFTATARLSITAERDPPFDCEPPETTTWTNASPITTDWSCTTGTTTAWTCADDVVSPSGLGYLLHVDGSYVLKANGSRIKLI